MMADAGTIPEGGPETTSRRFTHEEYIRMRETGILTAEESVELIHGRIVEKSPENTPHRAAVMKITRVLVERLDADTYAIQPQSTLPLGEYDAPEPDLAVLRGTPDELMGGELPVALVVEVADTSLDRDRGVKQELYARAGIPVYWIVDLTGRQLEVYSDPEKGRYREQTTVPENGSVNLPDPERSSVAVRALLPAAE
jgi:Uma2 family endonuclease